VLHSLHVGGAEVLAARLARQLQSSFRFVFVCLDEQGTLGDELSKEQFAVRVLGRRPGFDARCTWQLQQILKQERVDLVHAHQYTPFFYSLIARVLCRKPAILFTEHGRTFPDFRRPKRVLVNRLLLERRDRVVAVGKSVREALLRFEGIPKERVTVIYNGMNTAAYAPGVHDRNAVRAELGVGAEDLVILQVARLDPIKDHATALRTLEHVVWHHKHARLVLVGEGPELGNIQNLIRERGLETSVRVLGLRKDIPRLMRAADIFLLTSLSEGIPLTLIEAMAAGLPIVATQVGGVPELVEEGITGLLAPVADDAYLADCILRLARNPQLCEQMGELARQAAGRYFSESQMHAHYHHLYEEMLNA
jgi:sugar transferase (PEP-CTERM/EpsH1 system associated)